MFILVIGALGFLFGGFAGCAVGIIIGCVCEFVAAYN